MNLAWDRCLAIRALELCNRLSVCLKNLRKDLFQAEMFELKLVAALRIVENSTNKTKRSRLLGADLELAFRYRLVVIKRNMKLGRENEKNRERERAGNRPLEKQVIN